VSYADSCGQTTGPSSIAKLIVANRDCANAPNNTTNIEREFSIVLKYLKFYVTPEEIN
jgi:hypothetical protein